MYAAFGLLALAVAAEVAATSALPRADGFRDVGWSLLVLAGYALSIWLLALVVRHLSVSVTYALWAGLGTAAVAVVGTIFLGEQLSVVKAGGLALIVGGVVLLNLQGAH
jgi:small multidrug resistance pump